MEDLSGKLTGDELTAAEWNQLPSEVQNVITDKGIALSSGDLNQLGKALSDHALSGGFFTESGVIDAYVLSSLATNQNPTAYVAGMEVLFVAGVANSGGAATVNVAGLGVKSIVRMYGGYLEPFNGQIVGLTKLIYDGTNFSLSNRTASNANLIQQNITTRQWIGETAAEANNWSDAAWSPELKIFAAVSSDGTNRVMTSPDGITWTAESASSASIWEKVVWSPELSLFCAVATSATNRIMTSADGAAWTTRTDTSACDGFRGLIWAPGLSLFVAMGVNNSSGSGNFDLVVTSPDGITWTDRAVPNDDPIYYDVVWAEDQGLLVAVAVEGFDLGDDQVLTSTDGITWVERSASHKEDWLSLAYSQELGLFVAQATTGSPRGMTSPDGVTWTSMSSDFDGVGGSLLAIEWAPELGLFMVFGTQMATSPDGVTWTSRAMESAASTYSGTWSPELGVMIALRRSGTYRVQRTL